LTTPKVQTIKRQDARFYVSPDNTSLKYPGVTSVIGMLDKSFLQYWAAKLVAEAAVDNLPSVLGLAMNDRQGAIDYLKGAPRRNTAEAADAGTEAHGLFEKMALGKPLGRITPRMEPFVRHFDKFLVDKQPEYVYLEETVWSDEHRYAGSFDAYAVIDGERLWLDNKTTRSGIHAEVGIQLAAYRFAESIIRQDGSRVPMPGADGAAVIHVRPEGLKFVPVKADEQMFDIFLALREAFTYDKEVKSLVIGDEIYSTGYEDDEPAGPKRRVARPRKVA
jgi:hypothetical protein